MSVEIEKRFEILKGLPPYGPLYVPVSTDNEPFYHEGLVVKFIKRDGSEWIANFDVGGTNLKKILELDNSNNLLVIACGICYLFSIEKTKPISILGYSFSEYLKTENNQFIFNDCTDLLIVESNGEFHRTDRISFGGIKDLHYQNGFARGKAWEPNSKKGKWIDFEYDVKNRILKGGCFNKSRKWWEFWRI